MTRKTFYLPVIWTYFKVEQTLTDHSATAVFLCKDGWLWHTSIQSQFRPPLYRKELYMLCGAIRKVLFLHLSGSISHPAHPPRQNNYFKDYSDSFFNSLCSHWKPPNISHAGVPDDAALVHFLANAMHHEDNVCSFRWGVLRCCLLHVSPVETCPAAGGWGQEREHYYLRWCVPQQCACV